MLQICKSRIMGPVKSRCHFGRILNCSKCPIEVLLPFSGVPRDRVSIAALARIVHGQDGRAPPSILIKRGWIGSM